MTLPSAFVDSLGIQYKGYFFRWLVKCLQYFLSFCYCKTCLPSPGFLSLSNANIKWIHTKTCSGHSTLSFVKQKDTSSCSSHSSAGKRVQMLLVSFLEKSVRRDVLSDPFTSEAGFPEMMDRNVASWRSMKRNQNQINKEAHKFEHVLLKHFGFKFSRHYEIDQLCAN